MRIASPTYRSEDIMSNSNGNAALELTRQAFAEIREISALQTRIVDRVARADEKFTGAVEHLSKDVRGLEKRLLGTEVSVLQLQTGKTLLVGWSRGAKWVLGIAAVVFGAGGIAGSSSAIASMITALTK